MATDEAHGAEAGDVASPADFETFVTARAPQLLRFAYLMTGSHEAAEDALQTALTKACEHWRRVSRVDDPEAYVRRMIVNAHISGWRRFRRREFPVGEVHLDSTAADPATSVTNADLVWTLCGALPARQRTAVVLRYYVGLGNADIAELLGCPEATVRSAVHRALASLRALVDEGRDDDG